MSQDGAPGAPPRPEPEVIPTGDGDTYTLNMGPQHPAMHGVLRLLLTLRGEEILTCKPDIGFAHRAHEKMAENRNYMMFLPNTSRVDYLSGMIYNVAYCQALEKILSVEVPERAAYVRVIANELNRISSHLLWFGAFLLDLGGFTPFLYAFDDREEILEILDRVTGSRLTYCYARLGGLVNDVDDVFLERTRAFLARIRGRMDDYHKLVSGNVIFKRRCEGIGIIDRDVALRYGVTGPCLRGSGVPYDVRRAEPYGLYERFDFEVPTETRGDIWARYVVRLREMEQSCRIIEQALDGIPGGEIMAPKMPKKWKLPEGEFYFAAESARGHFGIYIVSDGTDVPLKMKLRTPSFSNLSAMPEVMANTMLADTIAILGSIDIVLPEVDR